MKFKIFIGVALSIIIILQIVIAGVLWYGASKLHNVQTSLSQKANSLDKSSAKISNDLGDIKAGLNTLNTNLAGR